MHMSKRSSRRGILFTSKEKKHLRKLVNVLIVPKCASPSTSKQPKLIYFHACELGQWLRMLTLTRAHAPASVLHFLRLWFVWFSLVSASLHFAKTLFTHFLWIGWIWIWTMRSNRRLGRIVLPFRVYSLGTLCACERHQAQIVLMDFRSTLHFVVENFLFIFDLSGCNQYCSLQGFQGKQGSVQLSPKGNVRPWCNSRL